MRRARTFILSDVPVPSFSQLTGIVVTAIVVLGCHADTMVSVILGLMAGGAATFFVSLAKEKAKARKP
ncbi:hypothetical protein FHS83_001102 [Rhizomicrobium palustre]|jgi:hypothetical protein|uniref:Uncharacterized protein n=1 Tax=Rhizomicrobium palustre TaxID=189966 RepID=A0A846MW91_9PROT|nr:hypothetical protein [Rhizomicrobium palustre]NIK87784.1 hypothetical protein [Rhizomicrobium palustre]